MIINLTQHAATKEQICAGVVDLDPVLKAQVTELLTFNTLPTETEVAKVAMDLAVVVRENFLPCKVMIGGAPFLMAPLDYCLMIHNFTAVYAFSVRKSIEETLPDGSVRKVAIFVHEGFVE